MSATIFQDNFNREESKVVGNGWAEYSKKDDDVALVDATGGHGHALQIRDNADGTFDGAATHGIITSSYNNLALSFDWRPLSDSDATDLLKVSWATSAVGAGDLTADNWTLLTSLALGGSSRTWNTAVLGASALGSLNNLSNFYLRFWIDLNGSDDDHEGVQIDNVLLTGDRMAAPTPAVVSEPTQLALFGLGMLSMASVMSRNKARRAS